MRPLADLLVGVLAQINSILHSAHIPHPIAPTSLPWQNSTNGWLSLRWMSRCWRLNLALRAAASYSQV
jgi:hypothetical protein